MFTCLHGHFVKAMCVVKLYFSYLLGQCFIVYVSLIAKYNYLSWTMDECNTLISAILKPGCVHVASPGLNNKNSVSAMKKN